MSPRAAALLAEGFRYADICEAAPRRPRIFAPPVLRGIASMAIEKILSALAEDGGGFYRGDRLRDLVDAADEGWGLGEGLREGLLGLEGGMDPCSAIAPGGGASAEEFLRWGRALRAFAAERLAR